MVNNITYLEQELLKKNSLNSFIIISLEKEKQELEAANINLMKNINDALFQIEVQEENIKDPNKYIKSALKNISSTQDESKKLIKSNTKNIALLESKIQKILKKIKATDNRLSIIINEHPKEGLLIKTYYDFINQLSTRNKEIIKSIEILEEEFEKLKKITTEDVINSSTVVSQIMKQKKQTDEKSTNKNTSMIASIVDLIADVENKIIK